MVLIGDIREINIDGIKSVNKAIDTKAIFSQTTVSQDISIGTKDT